MLTISVCNLDCTTNAWRLSSSLSRPGPWCCRVLSALAAAPRALAVVPRESWNAVTVTCAAAWALLGEIGAAGAQLAGLQANACRQAAAGTRVGRTATSAKQRWVATTAQLPEVSTLRPPGSHGTI